MPKTINLGEKRASESKNCKDWTVLDALKFLVQEIEAGNRSPKMAYIAMFELDKEDRNLGYYDYLAAGASNMELSGLLAQHLHRMCMPGAEHNEW